jgi:hypothetical protein
MKIDHCHILGIFSLKFGRMGPGIHDAAGARATC